MLQGSYDRVSTERAGLIATAVQNVQAGFNPLLLSPTRGEMEEGVCF
jgi:hypothetical protein